LIENQGFLYKIKNGKFRKNWAKLAHRDMYLYRNQHDLQHVKLHNLSGMFIQENEMIKHDSREFYSFSLISSTHTDVFATAKFDEFTTWLKVLRRVTGYADVENKYEFIKTISEGKFGKVKLARHKDTERIVAIKIISKADMQNGDIALIKSEIEILKIAQHPNLIQLLDIIENKSKMYIGMFMRY
jgi:hypothetical protein